MEQALACGASRREAGQAVVKAGVRAALERLMQHTGGPGLLLLPALAAGLLLAGVPPMLVGRAKPLLAVVCSYVAATCPCMFYDFGCKPFPCLVAHGTLCSPHSMAWEVQVVAK